MNSPIIPVQFVPVLEYAANHDERKAAFLVKAIIAAWRGDTDEIDVPPEFTDAWLALQGNLQRIEARANGGQKGGRPPKETLNAEGLTKETLNAEGLTKETLNAEGLTKETLNAEGGSRARIGEERRGKESIDNSPPYPPRGGVTDADFEAFWNAYGKKVERAAAVRAFAKAKKCPSWPGLDAVLDAVKAWRVSDEWTRDGGRYQPNAATWLNGLRWEDARPQEAKPEAPSADGWDRSLMP